MIDALLIILGFALMIKGADFFVDGSVGIAKIMKVPTIIIGLTIVAFGTSSPEAAVSVSAAIQSKHLMSLGNIIGSNIVNILLILGVAAMISPIRVETRMLKKEFPFMVLSSFILIVFYLLKEVLPPRVDGIILLMIFMIFMIILLKSAKEDIGFEVVIKHERKMYLLYAIIGLVMIIGGGILTTQHASRLAISLGMSELLVGLTILAIGTSLPELMTSVVASLKKENDIALGNVVGSNIFNVFFILGIALVIDPIKHQKSTLFDLILLSIVSIITFVFAYTGKSIKRFEGIILVIIYIIYMVYIIVRN